MRCSKNGVGADFGNHHVYPGDVFECPECGQKILAASHSIYDAEYKTQDSYIKIRERNNV